jgi:CBS domain-containing protein
MVTAKDIMVPWVVTTDTQTPITKAIDLMLEYRISGLPVIDENRKLVGIITEKDILQIYNTSLPLADMTVKDLMTTPVVHFDKDDSVDDIWACLLRNDFRRVPVTYAGKVVGIISRPDITRDILKKMRDTQPAEVN